MQTRVAVLRLDPPFYISSFVPFIRGRRGGGIIYVPSPQSRQSGLAALNNESRSHDEYDGLARMKEGLGHNTVAQPHNVSVFLL